MFWKRIKREQGIWIAFTFISVCFLAFRLLYAINNLSDIRMWPDSFVYFDLAKQLHLGDFTFLSLRRPFIYPLFISFFANNSQIIIMQTLLSALAWIFLCFQIIKQLTHYSTRLVTVIIIYGLGLSSVVIGWDAVLLTESLSLSFLLLFWGLIFSLFRDWSWFKIVLSIVVVMVFVFLRDSHAYYILLWGTLTGLVAFFKSDRQMAILAFFMLFFSITAVISSGKGRRWVYPFQNILSQRILNDREALTFFQKQGLPVSPSLLELAGKWAYSNNNAYYRDPNLEDYRQWLESSAKRTYVKWLAWKWRQTIMVPLDQMSRFIAFNKSWYYPETHKRILLDYLDFFFHPYAFAHFLWWLVPFMIGQALLLLKQNRKILWFIVFNFVFLFPQMILIFHADAMEISRHALGIDLQFYLGFWILVILLLDWFAGKFEINVQNIRG